MRTNTFHAKKVLVALFAVLLPLILSFSSCEWQLWGGDDAPDAGYYQIPIESLDGWHKGVCYFDGSSTSCDYYIVSCTDSIDGSITVCLSAGGNSDAGKAMTFHLSSSADVLKVTAPGFRFNGLSDDEKVDFTVYDVGDNIAGHFSIPYLLQDEAFPSRTSYPKVMDFDRFTDEALRFIGDSIQAVCGLGGEILRNAISDYLSGGLIGVAAMAFSGEVLSAKSVKGLLQMSYERDMTRFLGRTDIKIVSIKRSDDSTVIVKGHISNLSSIPTSYKTVHDGVACNVPNRVLYGVVIGNSPSSNRYLNKTCTELEYVTEEEFSFTFDIGAELGKQCYIRPFLQAEHSLRADGPMLPDAYTNTRYGETCRFVDVDIDLSNYKHLKCVRSESGSGYDAKFSIDAKISHLFEGIENWGIVIRTQFDNYAMSYRAKREDWYADIPAEMNFSCKLQLFEGLDVVERDFELISEFTITPFVEFKNSTPLVLNFEDKDYTFLVKGQSCTAAQHPHAVDLGLSVKWACCNVGASDTWAKGNFYSWGETESKGSYSVSKYKYVRDLDEDGDYMDDDANWIDIGTNISGTSYDVAHVKWGNGWRMPTYEDVVELYNECIWEYVYGGYQITGPNGRSIFLPAIGTQDPTCYWIGTLSKEEKSNSNAYYFRFLQNKYYGYSWDYRHRGFLVRPVKD